MTKILILGDSTSFSLGGESDNWLKFLAAKDIWSKDSQLIDTSAPGITAGAALATLLVSLMKSPFSISAVILSVGNCDRIRRPYLANVVTIRKLLKLFMFRAIGVKSKTKNRWAKLTLHEYVTDEPPAFEQNIENFAQALRLIKLTCKIFNIPLVAISPRSNLYFPPATASNNSLYYEVLNWGSIEMEFKDKAIPNFSENLSILDNAALSDYSYNLEIEDLASYDAPRLLCATNNLAVKLAKEGDLETATDILQEILDEKDVKKEFLFYNLAWISFAKKDYELAANFFELARTLDMGSYRVDIQYSRRFSEIFANSRNVKLIEVNQIDFLDHCHLLPKGQTELAKVITDCLFSFLPKGSETASIILRPTNPEILEGDTRSFFEMFGLDSQSIDPEELLKSNRAHALNHISKHEMDFLPKSNFIEILESYVFYSVTSQRIENADPLIIDLVDKERGRVYTLFGNIHTVPPESKFSMLTAQIQKEWVESILRNTLVEVNDFLELGINSSIRIRTIMNWYFRESLFFGFSSSHAMLYERGTFRRWNEALCMAYYLAADNGPTRLLILQYLTFIRNLEESLFQFYSNFNVREPMDGKLRQMELELSSKFKENWLAINEG